MQTALKRKSISNGRGRLTISRAHFLLLSNCFSHEMEKGIRPQFVQQNALHAEKTCEFRGRDPAQHARAKLAGKWQGQKLCNIYYGQTTVLQALKNAHPVMYYLRPISTKWFSFESLVHIAAEAILEGKNPCSALSCPKTPNCQDWRDVEIFGCWNVSLTTLLIL